MITRLGNGLVLGFLFTASFAWIGQSASAVSTDEGQQIADRGELDFSNSERARIQNSVLARHQAQGLAQAQQAPDATSSTLATFGFSQTPPQPSGESSYEVSTGHYEIPFQTYRDYLIVVQGSLGDTRRLNFIIDTGTNPSVVDSRIAQKLHMTGVGAKLGVHNQVVEVQKAVVPSLQIGALRAKFLPVLIRNLAFLQEGLGIRIDAVIGLDVLSRSNFNINYITKRFTFEAAPICGSSAPFQTTPPWLTVQMEVNGVSIHLLLDTAASGIILFHSRIRDRVPQLTRLGERMSSNMGGDFPLQLVLLASTKIAETDFGQQSAFVVEDQEDGSREFDGLLGPPALGLKQISFDFQRRTFSWRR